MDVIRPTKEKKKRHVTRRAKMAVEKEPRGDKRLSEIAQLGLGTTRAHYIQYHNYSINQLKLVFVHRKSRLFSLTIRLMPRYTTNCAVVQND